MAVRGVICGLRVGPRCGRVLRVLLLGLLLCAGLRPALAQFTRFQNVSDEQGLGNLAISALAQDRDGYILLGTEGGLYRYDGISATLYGDGLPSAAWIQQIVAEPDGRLWVVTNAGLYLRDGGAFARIDVGQAPPKLRSPHLLAVGDGGLVLDVGGTLLRAPLSAGPHPPAGGVAGGVANGVANGVGAFSPLLDQAALDGAPGLADARFVVSDPAGGLIAGCGTGLCRIEGGRVTVLGEAQGLPPDAWQVAFAAPDGTLWARSLERIAWRRPGQAGFAVARMPARGDGAAGEHTSYAANPEMLDLLADGHGGVLTQSASGVVDWDGTRWRPLSHHQGGLPPDRIQALMRDREGSLWIGSFGTGAFRSIGLDDWEHWTSDDGLPSDIVWSMLRLPDGQFWVATDSGTVRLGGPPAGLPAETNYIIEASRAGRLWLAPIGLPLMRRDPASGRIDRVASPGKVVTAEMDRDNRLWLGTPDGLFVVADADAPGDMLRAEPVMARDTTMVTMDASGAVWVLSPDGVFRRDAAGGFDLVVAPALLTGMPVALAFSPEGELWVGTGLGGVLRFRVADGRAEPLPSFAAPVIGSDNTLFVHRDRRGWMWVGTDHGVDVFDGQGWRRLDSNSGVITNDMNQTAVYEDTDGSMWFGTSHGLSHLLDPGRPRPQAALHPVVTAVLLGDRALRLAPSGHADWRPGPLVIRFVDLDYSRGRGITFRYRLAGLDAGWSATAGHEVRYSEVPTGQLRFELVAVDAAHGATSAVTGFDLAVRAPWWRRPWFYALCALGGLGVLWGTWRVRMRLLLHNQRRLEAVVGVRTAEIEQARSELQHQAGELERQAVDMERLAMSDALTGLANRRAIMGALEEAIAASLAAGAPLAVLLCDIDHFKRINDGFGHIAGDEVLADFSRRLADAVRAPEAVGRYGGEEFLLLLPGDPDGLAARVADLRAAITDAPYVFGEAERTVTASGGLAFLRAGDTAVSILERADMALYKAKENGRNRIEEERSEAAERRRDAPAAGESDAGKSDAGKSDAGEARAGGAEAGGAEAGGAEAGGAETASGRARRELERDLRAALAGDQFLLHYQPVVDMDRGLVTSHEALVRWHSPTRGNVSPVDFIPFAEEVGLIAEIGDWVLGTACREAAGWADGVAVSVNLSATQFRLPDLVGRVAGALRDAGLSPARLELEVTETAMIEDVAAAAAMLHELRAMGVTIALDDFGTGYSSLSFLRALPFDRVKIDRSFVQDLDTGPQALAIIRALVELCRGLGVAATAEGVETDRQIELLRAAGCSELQGFRIGVPRPPDQMAAWTGALGGWQPARVSAALA
ncbi:MAG: EAL domain-containing protein [Janthinobacterium lividum]